MPLLKKIEERVLMAPALRRHEGGGTLLACRAVRRAAEPERTMERLTRDFRIVNSKWTI